MYFPHRVWYKSYAWFMMIRSRAVSTLLLLHQSNRQACRKPWPMHPSSPPDVDQISINPSTREDRKKAIPSADQFDLRLYDVEVKYLGS